MDKTVYTNLSELNEIQTITMVSIQQWCRTKKVPIPRSEIVTFLTARGLGRGSIESILHSLLAKGYIREAIVISNKTAYVQLRSV